MLLVGLISFRAGPTGNALGKFARLPAYASFMQVIT
jgi:hypothetical protein